jgi:5-(carboxyamino)imidazole ribonucleotide synthase
VKVFPKPAALRIIKNKIIQKEFYKQHSIPSPAYTIVQNKQQLGSMLKDWLPAVQKLGEGGYDGRGVQIIQSAADLEKAFDAPVYSKRK